MKRAFWLNGCAAALFFLLSGGCAVLPVKSHADLRPDGVVGERDMLVEAAKAVETTPWPKPQPVSLISRIAGGGDSNRVTFSDSVAAYVTALHAPDGSVGPLAADARGNIADAVKLNDLARAAIHAPRLSTNDVTLVENAIRALRENRRVYEAAAKELKNSEGFIDPIEIEMIVHDYRAAVRALSETADRLAERIENDRSRTYAGPDRAVADTLNLSGI